MLTRYFLGGILLAFPLIVVAEGNPEAFSWAEVRKEVIEKNPEVLEARAQWKMSQAERVGAGAWSNPRLAFSEAKETDGEKSRHWRFEQEIPFPGKLTKESHLKRFQEKLAEARYQETVLRLSHEVRDLAYRLFRADRLAGISLKNVGVMKGMLRSMEARLASGGRVGMPSQGGEAFSLQAELGRMENDLFEQRQAHRLIEIQLNALMNRPLETPWASPDAPVLREFPLSFDRVAALARERSPLYESAFHEENHGRAMVSQARLGFAPDLGVMLEREKNREGMTGGEKGISLSIPLWATRPWGTLSGARAHYAEAQAAAQNRRTTVLKMAAMEYTETQTHLALARRYETVILPAAESAFRLARRQYESGGGNFLQMMEALRALLVAETGYENERYHAVEHWSALERWVGVSIESGD